YTYPRFSTRGLAQIMRLGCAARAGARDATPAARQVVAVTNAGDFAVSNAVTAGLVRTWKEKKAEHLLVYQFPAALHISHELLEPEVFDERYERVLSTLAGLIEGNL
ncbi:MAG: hypothetical protein ACYC9O_07275, partial [Candidatus Latescibacterota bacterium]